MSDYLHYLKEIQTDTSRKRLKGYLRYNFGSLIKKGDVILEIGPGTGEFIKFANECGTEGIDAIDRDEAVVKFLSYNLPVRHGWRSSVEELHQLEEKLDLYDIIFMLQVVEHVKKESLTGMLSLLYKHLKPGGRLLITVPNAANPLSIVERYSDITHENLFTENSLRQLVDMSDLENPVIALRGYKIPPYTPLNVLRIFLQKFLHLFLKAALIINGGVFFKILEPNITLEVQKPG